MSRLSSFRVLARASRGYHTGASYRSFSTRQVNLGNIHGDATVVSNDNVLQGTSQNQQAYASQAAKDETYFEPTISSHDDVVTPAPVNRG